MAALVRLFVRSGRSKDLESIVLRHQLQVLRPQINRPELNDDDPTLLGAIGAALPRRPRHGWVVTPETLALAPQAHRPAPDPTPRRCCVGTADASHKAETNQLDHPTEHRAATPPPTRS